MSLRRKTIVIIVATLVGLLLILFAVSQSILLSSFSQLEVKHTSEDVDRALGALSDDISSLVTMTRDWATWDDTYNFIENVNNAYIEANPTDQTMDGLRVNVMLFLNSSGQLVFSKAFDLNQGQEVPVPQSLLGLISPESILGNHPSTESSVSGIILLSEGPMLISSQPILTSQGEGPIRGALIMGRFLDLTEIGRLVETTGLSIAVQRLDDPQMTPDFQVARSSLSEGTPIFVRALDKQSVAGYTLLNDVYGNSIMMLKVDLPREIYQQGRSSQLYFIASILGVGVVFGLAVLLLLGKSVLSPLSRLSAAVSSIGKTGALSVRVPVAGKDELSSLSRDINRMLESLERSHNELRESEEKFKHLVEDMNDGYFVVQNFRIVFANARSAEMFGYSVEEVTGRTVEELLPTEVAKVLSEWYSRRLRGEAVPQQYEAMLSRDDGTTITVEFGSRRMYFAGRPAVSVVMRDISRRRQMEEALRESEAKYRDVVERANDVVAIVQDTIIKYINNRSSELLGYTPKQMIGTPMTEYVHPDELQRLISRYERRMAGEQLESIYETALLHKDGSRVDIEINVGLITYEGRLAELILVRDITERRKAQGALRKSEEHYSTLVRSLTDAVFKLRGREITWCNDRTEEIYGYKKDELIGEEVTVLFPEGVNRWKFIEEVATSIDKQGYFRGAHRVKRKNASLVDVEYTISQIQGTEPIELVAVARDITEQKRIEEEVARSEARYRSLFETASSGVAIIDLKGQFVLVNEALCSMVGYSQKELIARRFADFVHPDDAPGLLELFEEALAGRDLRPTLEFRAMHRGGRVLWLSSSPTALIQGNETIGFSAILYDVTERVQIEKALRRSEQKFRNVLDNSQDMVYSLNLQTARYEYLSPSSEKILGYTAEEVIQRSLEQTRATIHPEDQQILDENTIELIASKRASSVQYRVKHKELGYRWMSDSRSVICDEKNIPVLIVGSLRDINENKLAQEALRQREQDYLILLESTHDSIIVVDGETLKVVFGNRHAALMFGFDPVLQDGIGVNLLDFICPEDREMVMKGFIEDLYHRDRRERYDVRAKTKDGREIWISALATRIEFQGRVAVLLSLRDTTETRRAEQELLRLSDAVRMSTDSIVITDLQGNVVDANEATLKIQEASGKFDLIGLKSADFIAPEEQEKALKDLSQLMEKGYVNNIEYHILTREGKRVLVETNASLMRGKNGEPVGIVAVTRDITERKKMEEALRRSEQNYKVLFESTIDGMLVFDVDTMIILIANKAALRGLGFDRVEDIVGTNVLDLVHPDDRDGIVRVFMENEYGKGLDAIRELRAITRDGQQVWLSVIATRIEYEGKTADLVSARDITEHKMMEEEKQRIEEQLRLAGRLAAVGELASGVAHELNNPIAAIQGFAQFLTARRDLDETLRKDLDTIYRESQRAAKITQNLLSFARRHEPEKLVISINEAIEKTLELQAHPMKVNNIELILELDPELPKTLADFHQMQQVFINIINNAEQAMVEAHGKGRLVVKTQKVGSMIRISFADSGPGISEENMKRIFDPFFTTKEVGKGTGLGLSICYGLVEAHGGRIYARSKLGHGATFVVEIPIVSENQLVAESALLKLGSRGVTWKKPRGQY